MKKLGSKMFKGGAIGAGIGAAGGALYGNKMAEKEIANMPYDKVDIKGGKLPSFQFNEHWDGSVSWKINPGKAPEIELAKSGEADVRLDNIFTYAAVGMMLGGAGGALTAAALEAFNDEQ